MKKLMKSMLGLMKSIMGFILFLNVFGSFITIPLLLLNQYFLAYVFFIELSILATISVLIVHRENRL